MDAHIPARGLLGCIPDPLKNFVFVKPAPPSAVSVQAQKAASYEAAFLLVLQAFSKKNIRLACSVCVRHNADNFEPDFHVERGLMCAGVKLPDTLRQVVV